MVRSTAPRPRSKRRGRSSAQAEQEERASLAARVLGLPNCSRGELDEQWRVLWGTDPPRHASREFLVRAVAYGLQAEVLGGLDAKTLQLLRKANRSNGCVQSQSRASRLNKGAKLFREWHGDVHEVLVLEKGFAWRGETHASLSSIARAITGTRPKKGAGRPEMKDVEFVVRRQCGNGSISESVRALKDCVWGQTRDPLLG